MALSSTRFNATTAGAVQVFGAASTILNNGGASVSNPIFVNLTNASASRCYLSGTSAGTTANSYVFLAFTLLQFAMVRAEDMWAFSSNGVTAGLAIIGGQG